MNKMRFTFIRNASCSQGWLRWIVQVFFGTIIVTSFILILLLALANSGKSAPQPISRCRVRDCRVICNKAPFLNDFESDIIDAAWQADANCESIVLILKQPFFVNNTLSQNWLSGTRTNVKELAIIGGNLQYISSRAFISQFSNNIQTLILENIQLTSWGPKTFVGLSNLKQLYIKDCLLINVTRNALQAVDDTLEFLEIKASLQWDPSYITGSTDLSRLNVVDFSSNQFYNILDKSSFLKLRVCTILFLNSCRITSLGKGTFDKMASIKVLYLNDNYLVTIPGGLFDKILPLRPRIAMHDNYWHCHCSDSMFRSLLTKDVLMVDPVCRYPNHMTGITFSDFYYHCQNKSNPDDKTKDPLEDNCDINKVTKYININDFCRQESNVTDKTIQVITTRNDACNINTRIGTITNYWMEILNNGSNPRSSNWLNPRYSIQSNSRGMVELSSSSTPGQGLLWYQTSCPREIYCLNTMPNTLRIFESSFDIRYTFCPFDLRSGEIDSHECITYSLSDIETVYGFIDYHGILWYIVISVMCSVCGAICIYVIIHYNPHLLKGNKRILFVKHKEINALILPPDVPLRENSVSNYGLSDRKNNIFLVSKHKETLSSLDRSFSFRSSTSNEVSYISALQPTDEQLAQWRIRENCEKIQYDSLKSEKHSIFDADSLTYYSLKENDTPLEISKK